jgi:hypothetical protein
MTEEFKIKFNTVIQQLNYSRKFGQIAYSYQILCLRTGKPRLVQITGFRYIYGLLNPKVYYNCETSYSLQVQYDYIINHTEYMKQLEFQPYEENLVSIFSKHYGTVAYMKWYINYCRINYLHKLVNPLTTFGYKYIPEHLEQIYKGRLYTESYRNYGCIIYLHSFVIPFPKSINISIHVCLENIYEKRRKENYEGVLLELAYKIRIKKKVRFNGNNIRMILSYL